MAHPNHYSAEEVDTKRSVTLPLALAAIRSSLLATGLAGRSRGKLCRLGRSPEQPTVALGEGVQAWGASPVRQARPWRAHSETAKRVATAWRVLIEVLALAFLVAACGSSENLSAVEVGPSHAQQGAMHNCPQPGKWAISVWRGDSGTDTGQALATCGVGAVRCRLQHSR